MDMFMSRDLQCLRSELDFHGVAQIRYRTLHSHI